MTLTLYRPVGTAEAALIAKSGWKSFPQMPKGFGFYAYAQPVGDPREWAEQVNDIEWFEALEYGQTEVVGSWKAWGNSPDEYLIVWFEIDERLQPRLHAPMNVDAVNKALASKIEVCARYGPSDIWIDPRIVSSI